MVTKPAGVLILWLNLIAPLVANAECNEPFQRPQYNTRSHYCSPGEYVPDSYDFDKPILCELMEVDHLISLRQAWESDICGSDLKKFANDPRNLRLTFWETNRKKGVKTPEEFASTLPKGMADRVLRDAKSLRSEYEILPKTVIIKKQIRALHARPVKYIAVPVDLISDRIKSRIVYKKIGKRILVILGNKIIGYALTVGAIVDVLMISYWALDSLVDHTDQHRRATRLRAVLGLPLH